MGLRWGSLVGHLQLRLDSLVGHGRLGSLMPSTVGHKRLGSLIVNTELRIEEF